MAFHFAFFFWPVCLSLPGRDASFPSYKIEMCSMPFTLIPASTLPFLNHQLSQHPAQCQTSPERNRLAQILPDTQIPEAHMSSLVLAEDRNLDVSRQRPASSQGLLQDKSLNLEPTDHSKFSATAVFCSASHARNPARAFPPGSQGQQMRVQYLRRMSYPI